LPWSLDLGSGLRKNFHGTVTEIGLPPILGL
jgi:hypothetical protein